MSKGQVLIIEDAIDTRSNIAEILQSDGFTVLEAGDGATGLEILRSQRPDLVLCDIVMPVLDGYEVLRQLRAQPETALIPFVFLTGKDDRSDQRRGMCLGADDYLGKPFRRRELLETLYCQLAKFQQRNPQALQAQLQVLQLRDHENQAWVSGIVHDLRAPLTTIRVALELLEQAPEQSDRYFSIARRACQQSDDLIEEILTLYREEEDFATDAEDEVDGLRPLFPLFDRLQDGFQARCHSLQLQLHWSISEDLAACSLRSGLTVERILTELLNNACKYTSQGGTVEFSGRISPSVPEDSVLQPSEWLEILVRNEREIPAKALRYIFEKFYRGESSTAAPFQFEKPSSIPGSGLGLFLVQQLTTQLGGKLEVESQQGWTCFRLCLPLSG